MAKATRANGCVGNRHQAAGVKLTAIAKLLGGKLTDVGINDEFMKDAATALQPGTAGLFLLVRKMTTDKVLADLKGVGGTVMRTSFVEA